MALPGIPTAEDRGYASEKAAGGLVTYERKNPDIVEVTMEKSNNRVLNELLVNLFHNVMDAEAKAVITEEFKDITNNDMHIQLFIGIEELKSMFRIAGGTACHRGYPDYLI